MVGKVGRQVGIVFGASCLVVFLGTSSGCGGAEDALRADLVQLEQRVAELERTSGRQQVNVGELEEQVLLLADRVEAHRLSLERRGMVAARSETELPRYRPPQQRPVYSQGLPELPTQRLEPSPAPEPTEPGQPLVINNETLARFAAPEGEAPPPEAVSPPAPSRRSDSVRTARVEPPAGSADPIALYRESLDRFNAGEYAQALRGFDSFLASGPSDDYVDNALFWIGECQYALGSYQAALESFERVVADHPEGNKVPDSLLKIGLTYERLNDRREASLVLSRLVADYPTSDAARRASERLSELD